MSQDIIDGSGPLAGWRIAITRASSQATELVNGLQSFGATVIECPTIAIAPPENWADLDAAIERLEDYDGLLFVSSNGVDFFFKRLESTKRSIALPPRLRVYAVGPATAKQLQRWGIEAETSKQHDSEGLLQHLADQFGPNELRSLRFLLPRSLEGLNTLPDGLRGLGAKVDVVEAYRTVRPQINREELVQTLKARIDLIIFTSPSTVRNLAELLNTSDLKPYLLNTTVASIGPTTTAAANKLGLSVALEPSEHTSQALISEIANYARAKG